MFWILPVLAGTSWLAMLLAMLIGWTTSEHRVHYSSMDDNQTMAYISDIGASHRFKPMFIGCSAAMCACFDLAFLADRWLRHRGTLVPNGSVFQKSLGVLAILFAIAGTAGLVLLTIFDVAHHNRLHDGFLLLFLGGYVISAICVCWEYQRLGIHHRDVRILRMSFWIKLFFIIIEVILAVCFASLSWSDHSTQGAIIEWVIAFIFCFYAYSFVIDLWPAMRAHQRRRQQKEANKVSAQHSASYSAGGGSEMVEDGNVNGGRGNGPGYINPNLDRTNNINTTNASNRGYDGSYGESAARATRQPRKNNLVSRQLGSSASNLDVNRLSSISTLQQQQQQSYSNTNTNSNTLTSAIYDSNNASAAELPATSTFEPGRSYGERSELA